MINFIPPRRRFLKNAFLSALGLAACRFAASATESRAAVAGIVHTDDEWQKLLTPAQYGVLRHEGTERPFTSPLLSEHREGLFACVGCDNPLFSSITKFDSGTGWPSFYAALPGGIETRSDRSFLMERTEYHCTRCGGHHGHIFDDGPPPTGLRHCSNGVVLKFVPKLA